MAKKQNVEELTHNPNSRSKEKVERENAIQALEKAKQIPRKVVFLKQGASADFLSKKNETTERLFTTNEAAEYFDLSVSAFNQRKKKYKISYETKKGRLVFKQSVLDKHILKHPKN